MTYELEFVESAFKEWKKLDKNIQKMFKQALIKRLVNPRVESARLRTMKDCYKIKLRQIGYRLVYQVHDNEVIVLVVAVGKREKKTVYQNAITRLSH